ncbi:multidrug ABC transporter permease [Streptomonospora sediminis]
MRALAGTVRLELRLQRRYGFVYAAVFSAAVWLAVLLPMPLHYREIAAPYILIGDLAIVAFFFIAGSVFFEKGERTLYALVVTPLTFWHYISAKLITLTVLNLAVSLLVLVPAHGLDFGLGRALVGTALAALVFLLVSFATSAVYPGISDWLIPSSMWLTLLLAPLIDFSGLWEHPVFYVLPTYGPLLLFGAAFGQASPAAWEYAYAVAYPLVWTALLLVVARRVFFSHIVAGKGQ